MAKIAHFHQNSRLILGSNKAAPKQEKVPLMDSPGFHWRSRARWGLRGSYTFGAAWRRDFSRG